MSIKDTPKKTSELCRHLFFPMTEKERKGEPEESNNRDNFKRGSGGGDIDEKRIQNLRGDVDDNTTLATENRRMLVRIDERTAWIARLLVGVFMAILGGVYLAGGF